MSNTIHLNWAEKLALFEVLDLVMQDSAFLDQEHIDLIKRIETELNRYGEENEPSTTDVP